MSLRVLVFVFVAALLAAVVPAAAQIPIPPGWQAERVVGDHDRNTLRLRLDPQAEAAGFEPGMTVWIAGAGR